MTTQEKQTEIDNLIAILKAEGMPYPISGSLGQRLTDCRKLINVSRRAG